MSYYDEVLIKLHRDYGKDEMVKFAVTKIKELQVERGKNESYIYELTKELLDLKANIRNNKLKEFETEKQRYGLEIEKLKKVLTKRNSEIKEKNILITKLKKIKNYES
jgi:hypothetical protein